MNKKADARRNLLEQLQPLAGYRRLEHGETGDVTARPREARDEAAADRIGNDRENDRDGARLLQQSRSVGRALRKNEVGLKGDEFLRESLYRLRVAGCRPARVDPDVAALRPAELLKSLPECGGEGLSFRGALGKRHQHADPPHPVGLLRARHQRPGRRAAEKGDEIATPHGAAAAPISTALGVLGMPGMTAYVGLLEIGQPKPGETVVVAAASGAVGSVVGQIAKIKGCRAVGIAGGIEKCRFVVGELGFDACVDHRAPDFAKQLEAACPKGIDVYFENVGGAVQQTVWPLLNDFARIPVCGLIAQYNATTPMPGPDMFSVLRKRLLLRGFIVWDFAAKEADFLRDVGEWVRTGRLKYREDIVEGLEQAPASFLGMLQGRNFGKMLVRVASH